MRPRWFVRGDLDGFFGLFVDNLLQLMLIAVLCRIVCGFPTEFITGTVLPGSAISILVGNGFYAWQARRMAIATGREDITALPYGINTASLMAFIFLLMGPVYRATGDPMAAWRAGLFGCVFSALLELGGAFVADWLRRHTPRAALLSALAGVALTFIAMGFVFQIFASPLVAVLPVVLILLSYAGRLKMPFGLPGGLVAVLLGTAIAWILRLAGFPSFEPPAGSAALGFHAPVPVFHELARVLFNRDGWSYLAVIVPMGLFNIIGSLQNLESAEAAGDRFETRPSLLANGLGGLAAAIFGSPFPTTIYIGHPGWKAMGARHGYSLLNGVVIAALCLTGGVSLVLRVIPIEATIGILLWIGLVITAHAFQEVPRPHALAVALGLIPSLAAWALVLIETSLRAAGSSLLAAEPGFAGQLHLRGVIALSQGFLITSMVFSSVLVYFIDGDFRRAELWLLAGSALSFLGLIHAYDLTAAGVTNRFGFFAAPAFGLVYFLAAVVVLLLSRARRAAAR